TRFRTRSDPVPHRYYTDRTGSCGISGRPGTGRHNSDQSSDQLGLRPGPFTEKTGPE
ncbi:hypothetical protein HAX54_042865, partial [Datura stramonium]|nr:hypothetical protein [Datura stramonium]